MSKYKTAVVLPDIHAGYHEQGAVDLAIKIAADIKPDSIIQVGDFLDCYPISRYGKDPERATGTALQKEFDIGKGILDSLTKIAPTTILAGNHEARLTKYLQEKAPGLSGLRDLTIPKLLGIDNKNSFYKHGGVYLGKLYVIHGNEVSDRGVAYSAGTCRKAVEKLNMSVMHGHIHRLGAYFVTSRGQGVQKGFEIGSLCQRAQDYIDNANWQFGFAIVTYRNDGDKSFAVELIEIEELPKKKFRAIVRGKEYTN